MCLVHAVGAADIYRGSGEFEGEDLEILMVCIKKKSRQRVLCGLMVKEEIFYRSWPQGKLESRPTVTRLSLGCLILV